MKGKNFIKHVATLVLATTTIFSFAACNPTNNDHDHVWQNYVVKYPSCTTTGTLEKICKDCGQKVYEDIQANGHTYAEGKCKVCGLPGYAENELVHIPLPETVNVSKLWSMGEIYQTATNFGYIDSYYDFIDDMSNAWAQDIYLDNLGLLHASIIFDYSDGEGTISADLPLALYWEKVSIDNPIQNLTQQIYKIEFKNEEMLITYSDGLKISTGKVVNTTSNSEYIVGFGISASQELIICYADETIAFAGKIALGATPQNQSGFIYTSTSNNSYTISEIHVDSNIVEIPISHRGKPILMIESFYGASNQSIIIPAGIQITDEALSKLSSSVTLYLVGERSEYNANLAYATPQFTCYAEGEWSYVNGVPQPNN